MTVEFFLTLHSGCRGGSSELIGMSPQLKSNSIIQLVLQALYAIKPGKR
jgi:hypothetical protein